MSKLIEYMNGQIRFLEQLANLLIPEGMEEQYYDKVIFQWNEPDEEEHNPDLVRGEKL